MQTDLDWHLVYPKGEKPLWVFATDSEIAQYCRDCHKKLHKKKIAAKEAARAKGLLNEAK